MRVVIAEDLALLRDGLARLLRAHDFEVVAEVGDPWRWRRHGGARSPSTW